MCYLTFHSGSANEAFVTGTLKLSIRLKEAVGYR